MGDLPPDGDELLSELKQLNIHLAYLADNTGKIAGAISGSTTFVKKWGHWIAIAIMAIYPKIDQFIKSIPLPHA
jgi:hypothetical protein